MTGLSPRAQAKRTQITTAARRLFLEQGFAATSMDAIAATAGVSKQTLYSYFPGKEEMLTQVLLELIQDLAPDMQAGLPAPQTAAEMKAALSGLAGKILSGIMHPDYVALVRVVVAETPRLPQLGRLFRSTVPERILHGVAALLEQARGHGLVAFDDADAAARLFMGPLLTYVLMDGLFAGDAPPLVPDRQHVDAVINLFMRAIDLH